MAQGMVQVVPTHPGDFRIYNYTSSVSTASGTSILKSGGGVLHGFFVTATGSAATATSNIVDGTASAGTVLFSFSGTAAATNTLGIDLAFTTGLTIVSGAVTATTPTLLVLWK